MDQFKLAVWNIENSDRLVGADLLPSFALADRLDAIAEEIAGIDADILLVGEGPKGEARAAALFERVAPGYSLVTRGSVDWRDYGTQGAQWLWYLIRNEVPIRGRLQHLDRWQALTAAGWGDQRRGAKWQCRRRSKSEPPCRPNIEPGVEAASERVGCG